MFWGDWGHPIWGVLMMLVFWGAVIAVVVLLIRGFGRQANPPATPEEILAERFARGEISKEEYEERKRTLAGR